MPARWTAPARRPLSRALHGRNGVGFWHWPKERRPAFGRPRAALHAKLIAADERSALLGSANLTDRALADCLETGVVLREPSAILSRTRSTRTPRSAALASSASGPPGSGKSLLAIHHAAALEIAGRAVPLIRALETAPAAS